MSQSGDNVASMHDHLLTVHAHKTWRHSSCTDYIIIYSSCTNSPLVPCACADGGGCRGHTPWQSKQVCYGNVLALLERCYRTTDRYEQTSPLASLEARFTQTLPTLSRSYNTMQFNPGPYGGWAVRLWRAGFLVHNGIR